MQSAEDDETARRVTGMPPTLLTVTWSGDRAHFALLRESLIRSALADCPHLVIVQDEDLQQFEAFRGPGMVLHSSAEWLPSEVERKRRSALRWQRASGRRGTTLAGSLARRIGWPNWVRYIGWHTQQLCKLAAAAASRADTVVVLDSDVIVTPYARPQDFRGAGQEKVFCYQQWQPIARLSRKAFHWQRSAFKLLDLSFPSDGLFDTYYDTPFVLSPMAVRQLLAWLEWRYDRPWWRSLLAQPPRHWSEFGLYRTWLRYRFPGAVDWHDPHQVGYLYDASDTGKLLADFQRLLHREHCHYITIHSQSSGRYDWHPDRYAEGIQALLRTGR